MNRLSDVIPDTIPDEKQRRKRRSKEEIIEDLQAKLAKATGGDSGLDLKQPKSMEKELSVFVGGINSMLYLTPWTYPDALTQMEAMALIHGWDTSQQTDPKFRKWTQKFVSNTGKLGLFGALAMIGVNRLIRHDILPVPDETKAAMKAQMEAMSAQFQKEMEETARQREQYSQQHEQVQPLSEVWQAEAVS